MKKDQDTGDGHDRDLFLWQRILDNDKEALGELFDRYARELLAYGFRIHSDLPLIKDLVQDVFVDVWMYREGLSRQVKVKFYLYQCLRNALLRQLAKNKTGFTSDQDMHNITDPVDSPEIRFLQLEEESYQQNRLSRSLRLLTPREREVVSLKYYSDLKLREIAALLDLKEQTIANTLQNALSKLRKHLVSSFFLLLFLN